MDRVFPMTDPPDYEPPPERSIAGIAAAERRAPEQVLYDKLVEGAGDSTLLWAMMNYSAGSTEAVREMIVHPLSLVGIGDGGAHCLSLCDATTPTTILTHWVRDRTRGERIPLELAVHKLTQNPAMHLGLNDRGVLADGLRADINLIDLDNLRLRKPEFVNDLPGGGRRVIQRTQGYVGTLVKGVRVLENGLDTGERPGKVIRRGERPAGN
jgi:N-acyl-D-aspartate/D-glutamate deacylase